MKQPPGDDRQTADATPAPAAGIPAGAVSVDVWRAAIPLLVGAGVALLPVPNGLAAHAWFYFAVFAAVILALITEPISATGVGIIGVTLVAVTGIVFTPAQLADPAFKLPAEAVRWALAGFANSTIWLIFGAFVFAMGYEKTGLGRRIALVLVRRLGGRSLGLGYAIMLADLVLAPFTPSNSARSAGTIYPLVRSIPELYGSRPGESARRIGSYLMWVAFATTCVTSSMFVTALAPNLLALEIIRKTTGLEITWLQWFTGFLPVGGLLVALLPWLIYKLFPPEVRASAEVPKWAAQELAKMGGLTAREAIMGTLVAMALVLWIFGGRIIDPTLVALVAISLMLVCRVVTWDDILANKSAWNVLTWFATLFVLADGLNRVGFVGWLGRATAAQLAGHSPTVVMTALVVLFFLMHYMFASLTAHTTAVLPVILAAGVAVPDMPVRTFALLLAFSLGIMGVITPYATGPAPVYFGSGYFSRREFWTLGLVFGLIFLGALLLIGLPVLRLTAP
ncbi:MAG: anion permease [Opitutus sp.]|nr:anion permease [Opitutus sp.]